MYNGLRVGPVTAVLEMNLDEPDGLVYVKVFGRDGVTKIELKNEYHNPIALKKKLEKIRQER